MKKILVALTLSFLSLVAFGQQHDKDYYLAKSKRQKTTGRILLIGGGTLFAASFLSLVKYESVYVTYLGGIGIAIAGVPFMNASVRNKRMAAAISAYFELNNAPSFYLRSINSICYPSLVVKIHLDKPKKFSYSGN